MGHAVYDQRKISLLEQEIKDLRLALAEKTVAERERCERCEELLAKTIVALEESVKLQSHYAGILNAHDGGKRLQFDNAAAWVQRLAAIRKGE